MYVTVNQSNPVFPIFFIFYKQCLHNYVAVTLCNKRFREM